MRNILIAAACVSTGLAGAGLAQDAETGQEPAFCTAEYNPDAGDMTDEDRTTSEFAEMDTNGDGMVSQQEYIDCRMAARDS